MTATWTQHPLEKRDYQQPVTGDTIASASWLIGPAGPTLSSPINESTKSTVRVSGIMVGVLYTLRCHVVTAGGQELDGHTTILGEAI